MKSNIFIISLIDSYGINLAREVSMRVNFSFYNLSEALSLPKINCKTDLNKLAQNCNLIKISNEQLQIINSLSEAVFYSNNFNLLSQNFLEKLKLTCAVVYVKHTKSDYLESEWQQNINTATKFKANLQVFETRDKAYISCAEVVINGEENIKATASKLIKKLEKL